MKSIFRIILTSYIILHTSYFLNAQVAINSDGASPDVSAILDVTSASKGILIPRMDSTSRINISNPATGLMVFDSTTNSFWYYANATWNNLNSAFLADTDGDTKIQVEESGDDDIIRFDMNGTEFICLDSGRIEIVNTGNSTLIGEGAGENDDFSNNNNVFIGHQSGYSSTTGYENTFIGYQSGYYHTTGYSNVFLGTNAGYKNETGLDNVFLGRSAGYNSIGSDNVFLGRGAGYNNYGSDNVFLGRSAGFNESGSNKLYIENSNSSSPLIYGEFDNDLLRVNGTLNINSAFSFPTTDGTVNQFLTTDGSGTLSWTTQNNTLLMDADGDTKIQVEESSDEDIIRFDMNGTEFIRLDSGRIEFVNNGYSVFIGEGAGASDDYDENDNVFIGYQSGNSNTYGLENVFIGYESGYSNIDGNDNIFVGRRAGYENEDNNVFLGNNAGYKNVNGEDNVFVGRSAGYNSTGSDNIFLGRSAGTNETGSDKLYIENSSASSPLIYGEFDNDLLRINGTLNINNAFSFPTADGTSNQILVTDGSGSLTWTDNITNTDNQTIDVLSFSNNTLSISLEDDGESDQTVDLSNLELSIITDGDNDTKIQVEESSDEDIIRFDLDGKEYLRLDKGRIEILNTGSSILIGENAGLNDDLNDRQNIAIGESTMQSISSGAYNVAVGYNAGFSLTGYNNLLLGDRAATSLSSGSENVILGKSAGGALTGGSGNVMLGSYAGGTTDVNSQLFIDNSNTDNPLIWGDFSNDELVFNGDVGIGTSPTKAKLEIDGNGSSQSFTSTHGVLITAGAGTNTSTNTSLSIYATSNVAAQAFIAFSDERIKNIQGISNSKNDLNTLMDIQITDYTMKDTISQGSEITKKVIAQQVAEVYPQAVNTNLTDVIPNIYKRATIDQNGWVQLSTDLKVADRVQIIFDDKKEILEVLEVKENAFRVHSKFKIQNSKLIFVYGQEVNDFHTVDYEAISMLNVSATQQLAKENETLKDRMNKLEEENEQLKSQVKKINELEAKLEAILSKSVNQ